MNLKFQSVIRKLTLTVVLSVIIVSCNQKTESKTSKKAEEKTVVEPKKEETLNLNIEDYFPAPNYMGYIILEDNKLNLTDKQNEVFKVWRTEKQPQIQSKMKEIHAIDAEIKQLSEQKVPLDEIQEKVNQTNELRKEIAEIKLQCRALIIENLNDTQWKTLVENYPNKFPFKERTEMMNLVNHVNPVPNYMQTINANSDDLGLSEDQKKTLDDWNKENHPKIMAMANKITALEKDIYQESLQNAGKTEILEKLTQIENIKKDIVAKKTHCRDLVVKTLSLEQWSILIAKTN